LKRRISTTSKRITSLHDTKVLVDAHPPIGETLSDFRKWALANEQNADECERIILKDVWDFVEQTRDPHSYKVWEIFTRSYANVAAQLGIKVNFVDWH
jgi:hypothetical protein